MKRDRRDTIPPITLQSRDAVVQADEHESVRDAVLRTFFTMAYTEVCRKRYREERRLRDELGFDVVDLGGEG